MMAQVGHGDSKLTLGIYAQVLKRRERTHIGLQALATDGQLIRRDDKQWGTPPKRNVAVGPSSSRACGAVRAV